MIGFLVIGYLVVAIAYGMRLYVVSKRFAMSIAQDIDMAKYLPRLFKDSLLWLFSVIWYGMENVIRELK